jgi:hypothetical protein
MISVQDTSTLHRLLAPDTDLHWAASFAAFPLFALMRHEGSRDGSEAPTADGRRRLRFKSYARSGSTAHPPGGGVQFQQSLYPG